MQLPYGDLTILADASVKVASGKQVAITGVSGSGKTTLLGLLAALDTPTSGQVLIGEVDITNISENARAAVRRQNGFIFQNFQLLPRLTALENVMFPLEILSQANSRDLAMALLTQLGLQDRATHYPWQLSGGEQQRVAIARAYVTKPKIVFADEPTGNLDEKTSKQIIELLFQLNKQHNTTMLIVTHDQTIAAQCDQNLTISEGRIATKA